MIVVDLDKRGRCFRTDELLAPETVSSAAVFGEIFPIESWDEKSHLCKEGSSALKQRTLLFLLQGAALTARTRCGHAAI